MRPAHLAPVALALSVGGLLAARAAAGWGPPLDRSRFTSVIPLPDGERLLVSAHRHVFKSAEGLLALPDGRTKTLEDWSVVGVYSLASKEWRRLRRDDAGPYVGGNEGMRFRAACGLFALAGRGGQLRGNGRGLRYGSETFLVDLRSFEFKALPAVDALGADPASPASVRLAGSGGSVLVEKGDPNAKTRRLLLLEDGALRDVGPIETYYAAARGKAWFWDGKLRALDLASGAVADGDEREYRRAALEPEKGCVEGPGPYSAGADAIERSGDGKTEKLPLTLASVLGEPPAAR